jgi:hypothetical protein
MDRRTALKVAAGGIVGALWPFGPALACTLFPADGEIEFLALRHGRVVGGHRIRFARPGGRFVVRTDIEIAPDAPGAPVPRLVHHAEEVWVDGWLHAVTSDTDDDGRLYRVRAERRDGIFGGIANGVRFTVSGYIVPSSLWHRDTVASETLFDTVDGRVKLVRARLLGAQAVPGEGRTVTAKHYRLDGEIARELWYGPDCELVRVAFAARDGSRITLERR